VSDNGRGIRPKAAAPSAAASGWGLAIMRERAESLGGAFRLETRQGEGTSITVEIGGT